VQVGPLVGWLVGLVGAFVVGSEVGVCVVVVTVTPEICSAVGTGTVMPCAELALETAVANDSGVRLAALALALADLACETVAMNARVMLDRRSLRLAWDDILQSLSKTPANVAIPY
jgi:hypothetical protein